MKAESAPKVMPPALPPTGEVEASRVWESLAPRLLYPAKVVIIEALLRVGMPMSATGLGAMLEDTNLPAGRISYHLAKMAKAKVVTVVTVRRVRGAVELFYYFPPAGESGDRTEVDTEAAK